MKKVKWLIAAVVFLLGITAVGNYFTERTLVSNTYSQYLVLMERSGHKIIASKKGEEKMYPASMTKIMTALIAVEEISNDQKKVGIPAELVSKAKSQGASTAGFSGGEVVTIRDLIYGIMLPSGAECCYRIVKYLDGSELKFAERMNRKARELGMNHTHFSNATGLFEENHYTTAKDMAILLDYALKNEKFRKIFTSMTYQVSQTNLSASNRTLYSTLFPYREKLRLSNGRYLGGKTGYTDEAGLCLASLAKIKGREYLLVTGKAKGNHQTKPYHILDAIRIFEKL